MNFTLNDREVNFKIDNSNIDFTLNDGVVNFKLNASVVILDTCFRVLESGGRRLLETGGGSRLLEDCGGSSNIDNTLDATLDFTI